MPSIVAASSSDELFESSTQAFTVLRSEYPSLEDELPVVLARPPFTKHSDRQPPKNVNVVKPVQRVNNPDPEPPREYSFRVIEDDEPPEDRREPPVENRRRKHKRPPDLAPPPPQSHTILDPHFSRHLDLKLRRLKEKEIIAERLAKRSRDRQRELLSEPTVIPKSSAVQQKVIRPSVVNLELPGMTGLEATADQRVTNKSPSNKGSRVNLDERPMFVTTVKKGEFLPPPASMANLLGIKSCERLGGTGVVPTLVYTYSSRPKVLGARTTAEKSTETAKGALVALASLAVAAATIRSRAGQSKYGNLMTDRRIIRGSTSNFREGGFVEGYDMVEGAARGARAAAARRRAVARRRGPGAPGMLAGSLNRKSEPVQTDPYLEELYDKGKEMEIGVQTDLMLDRMETPVYVSSANGSDVATQVLPGELFDFEAEVEPVLDVLVDKTIEQALAECLEEEELAHLRKQAAAAAELREQAAASARHRQRHLMRIQDDKEKRAEYEEEAAERLQSERYAAAAVLVKTHLPPILPTVLDALREQGYISDSNPDTFPEMDDTFMSWLMGEVTQEVESMITSKDVLMDIVKEVIETRAELYRAMGEDETVISSSVVTSETSQKNEYDQIDDGDNMDELYDKNDVVEE